MRALHKKLLNWYGKNSRDLPWRRTRDPYPIWLSEIMLQQTRVETVIPYYEKFLARFPRIEDLAKADIDLLRSMWAGLGYYSRVVNLQKAAQKVVADFGGRMPRRVEELRTLPGIGPYTAAAIASIAFAENTAAIDGNLERVIARQIALKKIAKGAPEIRAFADALVALGDAGSVNQAFMDLSSTICAVKNPKCMICPIAENCEGRKQGIAAEIPMKAPKRAKEEIEAQALLVLHRKNEKSEYEILIARRPEGAWLSGMWDLPWTIRDRDAPPQLPRLKKLGTARVKRTITHHKVQFTVDYGRLTAKPEKDLLVKALRAAGRDFRWLPLTNIDELPNPSRKAIAAALKSLDSTR